MDELQRLGFEAADCEALEPNGPNCWTTRANAATLHHRTAEHLRKTAARLLNFGEIDELHAQRMRAFASALAFTFDASETNDPDEVTVVGSYHLTESEKRRVRDDGHLAALDQDPMLPELPWNVNDFQQGRPTEMNPPY